MIDKFLAQLFVERSYPLDSIITYIFAGILAGLTRLIIDDQRHLRFHVWWKDGSLLGAIIISIAGALLIDHNFVWSFLGGYFITYILEYIQKGLEKVTRKKGEDKENGTPTN
jgi:hypothetical protein